VPLRHHELCYGCGTQNLFGLQMEVEEADEGRVAGRFFVKQDHQGPPGFAHGGVLAAALDEAMGLALEVRGLRTLTRRIEVDFQEPAPIGAFVQVEAAVDRQEGEDIFTTARATGGDDGSETLAEARATFRVVDSAGV
jgi:acyl-coenzyme A thioesterase PaaI-like protein